MSESSSSASKSPDPATGIATAPDAASLPPDLKFLKRLVTTLTVTMIAGLLVIVALLVIRLWQPVAPNPILPDTIALPDGLSAIAVTTGPGWYAVVTDSQEILIYDRGTGAIAQRVAIELR